MSFQERCNMGGYIRTVKKELLEIVDRADDIIAYSVDDQMIALGLVAKSNAINGLMSLEIYTINEGK